MSFSQQVSLIIDKWCVFASLTCVFNNTSDQRTLILLCLCASNSSSFEFPLFTPQLATFLLNSSQAGRHGCNAYFEARAARSRQHRQTERSCLRTWPSFAHFQHQLPWHLLAQGSRAKQQPVVNSSLLGRRAACTAKGVRITLARTHEYISALTAYIKTNVLRAAFAGGAHSNDPVALASVRTL